MHRTFWLSILTLGCLAVGVWTRSQWPSPASALDCPLKKVRVTTSAGAPVVFCGEVVADSQPAQGGALLTVGGKLNLNRASADELTLVPGVGPTKLRSLQRWTDLADREPDASD